MNKKSRDIPSLGSLVAVLCKLSDRLEAEPGAELRARGAQVLLYALGWTTDSPAQSHLVSMLEQMSERAGPEQAARLAPAVLD
jgi:hypothetical protein